MNVLQGAFNLSEKLLIAFIGLSANLADVIVVDLFLKNVLIHFADFWEIQFLYQLEGNEFFDISVDRCAINLRQRFLHERLELPERDMPALVVEKKLNQGLFGRRHPQTPGSQVHNKIFMFFHGLNSKDGNIERAPRNHIAKLTHIKKIIASPRD